MEPDSSKWGPKCFPEREEDRGQPSARRTVTHMTHSAIESKLSAAFVPNTGYNCYASFMALSSKRDIKTYCYMNTVTLLATISWNLSQCFVSRYHGHTIWKCAICTFMEWMLTKEHTGSTLVGSEENSDSGTNFSWSESFDRLGALWGQALLSQSLDYITKVFYQVP